MPNSGYFDEVFANAGDLTPVPDAVQPSGSISYAQGWGAFYSQDPTVDPSTALLIDRAQTNQLFFDITSAIQAYQQFGTPPFITTSMNGGTAYSYPKYARVLYSGATYQSLKAANTDLPSVASSWQVDESNSLGVEVETGTNYNPAAGDNARLVQRSNSGTPMADTLPGTSGALANGWFAYIENLDGAGADVFSVGSGGSITVGGVAAANGFVIQPGEVWFIISEGSGNYVALRIGTASLHSTPPQGSRKNLIGVWASNSTYTLTADALVLRDSNGNSKTISSFNKTLNTATSGAGGLDTGSIAASTFYFVYAIYNAATGTQNILISLSATAPTLPSGYTYFARISSILTDSSSNIRRTNQADDLITYQDPIAILNGGTATSPASVSTTTAIPSTAGSGRFFMVNEIDNVGAIAFLYQNNNSHAFASSVSNGTNFYGNPIEFVIANQEVWYNAAGGITGDVVIEVQGYRENF